MFIVVDEIIMFYADILSFFAKDWVVYVLAVAVRQRMLGVFDGLLYFICFNTISDNAKYDVLKLLDNYDKQCASSTHTKLILGNCVIWNNISDMSISGVINNNLTLFSLINVNIFSLCS